VLVGFLILLSTPLASRPNSLAAPLFFIFGTTEQLSVVE
jgi:hypothetical protein